MPLRDPSTLASLAPPSPLAIVATDCGSTTTKAILIELVDGVYRQTHRGEARIMPGADHARHGAAARVPSARPSTGF